MGGLGRQKRLVGCVMEGIYRVWIGPKYYWGKSKDVPKRLQQHIVLLCKGTHNNPKMQRAFEKYGRVRGELYKEVPYGIEQDTFEAALIHRHIGSSECMNCRIEDGLGGFKHTEETRRKIAEASRKRGFTDEARELCRLAKLGKQRSEETKQKLRRALTGYKHTPEAVASMTAATRRRMERGDVLQRPVRFRGPSGEKIEFMSLMNAAKHFGYTHCANLSAMLTGKRPWPVDPKRSRLAGWVGEYIS